MSETLRRSMLFVPGSNAAMLSTSFIYDADAVMFDLEDSVSLREKDTARMLVYNVLGHPLYQNIETVVRVNALDSEFGRADVMAMVKAGVNVIRLPKTDSLQDVVDMEMVIEHAEVEFGRELGSTKMLAAIESAMGINNAVSIAHASKRLIGVALGAEDYVRDLRTQRSPEGTELLFARCSILQAARSAGIMAFDTVYSDSANEAGFLKEARHIHSLGFDGKSLINPRQIELLHNVFAPSKEEVEHAIAVIEVAEEAELKGSGVVSLNGKMVDAPIIERARWTLERAKSGIKQ
ncbi:citrate (pro-3S)-lyase subunit beta [Vibrio aestuarianus]|nr:citrate (pro-3S)-lyase subunit beta [Vibrio aestuarianus]MDE1228668.1 citrate (pro-3S)-lyase subunit beta [Vibrio aestuarianus]MDE1255243.1 citrate (pro-3S)-lyase subunit beta [Vibrio aestuarianus]MDE1272812.1 citrate (pro-3S)-lyase subunit beta [Vibrio aestuarianus]MDE1294181.1 citrate (pro-3S)-lyase subunit beta [Vibrio aestuarianus]MDE1308326.1 citrate (pro-3S)-lyase subunit beta [Vibrio aestuarianus]